MTIRRSYSSVCNNRLVLENSRIVKAKTTICFQKRPKDGTESALCSIMSTGLVDIYEVKPSQRHLLATIENNRLVSPIES